MNALQTSITATKMPFAMIKLRFSPAPVNQDTREMEETALVNITFFLLFCFIGCELVFVNWIQFKSCISLSSKALHHSFFRN